MFNFKPPVVAKEKEIQPTVKRLRAFKRSDEKSNQEPTKQCPSSNLSDIILTRNAPEDITQPLTLNPVPEYVSSLSLPNKFLPKHIVQNFLNKESVWMMLHSVLLLSPALDLITVNIYYYLSLYQIQFIVRPRSIPKINSKQQNPFSAITNDWYK